MTKIGKFTKMLKLVRVAKTVQIFEKYVACAVLSTVTCAFLALIAMHGSTR